MEARYIVRLWDGFDHTWLDVSEEVSYEEAKLIWTAKTNNGTRNVTYSDIDYYKIFPAQTRMLYGG